MEYSELLYEFTDGTLESVRETELFNALATNEELRADFKHHLAMKSAIRSDVKAYTPATQSTLNIFSSLGFVPPPVATSSGIGTAVVGATKSTGFFSRYGTAIITGALAIIATGVISYWLFNSQLSELKDENRNLTLALHKEKEKKVIPIVQNFARDDLKKSSDETEKIKIKYIYVQKQEPTTPKPELMDDGKLVMDSEQLKQNNTPMASSALRLFEKVNLGNMKYDLPIMNGLMPMNRIANNSEYDDSFLGNIRTDMGFSLEISNMQNWFDVAPTITPSEYNKFNNTSVTLFYSIFDNFQIGADYRRETFFQRFEGKDKEGILNRYEQQPNFESVGLVLRYADKDLNLWGIHPYFQIYGGGTNVGYIFRGGLGLKYSLMDYLSFVLGANASSLSYKYAGVSWQSNRYDLIYGLSFEF